MSTSTINTKNVQRTTKTREPSKDRIKSKKDEAQTKSKIAKTKSTDPATPSSTRTKTDPPGSLRTGSRQPKKEEISKTSTSRLKKSELDKSSKTSPKPKTISSTRKAAENVKTPTSTRLKTDADKTQANSKVKAVAGRTSTRTSTVSKVDSSRRIKVSSRKPGSPSSRINKTQYIPNTKEMISNALKSISKENSFVEETGSLDSSACSTLERPRTATLRKGSIVNMNIAGPDVPKIKKKSSSLEKSNSREKQIKEYVDDKKKKMQNDEKEGSDDTNKINKISNLEKSKNKIDKSEKLNEDQNNLKTNKAKSKIEDDGSGDHIINERRNNHEDNLSALENKNILSNEKLKEGISNLLRTESQVDEDTQNDEYDYDEDFDSYASDFDDYQSTSETSGFTLNSSEEGEISTSSSTTDEGEMEAETKPRINSAEEERKLDSGNFDMPENKHKQILGNITELTELTNGSLSDEGFDEIKSLQFVNFLGAKKKRDFQRSQSRRNKRGEELLGMIRLDQRNFTLLDIPPVSYDIFIKSFGNRNSTQISSQTHEDDVAEETQTEVISSENKWTQFPIKFPRSINPDDSFVMNYKGVGGDVVEENEQAVTYNEYNLASFLRNSGQVVLALLEENEGLHLHNKDLSRNNLNKNISDENVDNNENDKNSEINLSNKENQYEFKSSQEIPTSDKSFCDSGVVLCADFLKPRKVSCLSFSIGGLLKLVTVHPPEEGDSVLKEFELKSVGCVWDPSDFSAPEDLFTGFGNVDCVCFAATNNKMIFGGLEDGTVALWDLLEKQMEGDGSFFEVKSQDSKKQVRITNAAKCTTEPDIENGCARIVAVLSIMEVLESSQKFETTTGNNLQVLSLSEIGHLIIWGLITHESTYKGASLVKFSVFSLGDANPELIDLHCTDMCIDQTDPNHVYVATNYGYTLYCLVTGSKTSQKKYLPESTSKANCIEPCHHRKDCFMVGFENGNISIYTKSTEKPLTTFNDRIGEENPVKMVEWSRNRPWIFYTTDSDKTVHIWDLTYSEHFPSFSVPFEDSIKMIKLSEPTNINNKRSYMAIISKNEKIHLHQLTGDHSRMTPDDYLKELNVFTKYINRL